MPTELMQKRSPVDYILDRTFQRPREAIIHLNECIARSEGASRISAQIIQQAESNYSQQRLRSVADEWRREYPFLVEYCRLLERRAIPFRVSDLTMEDCEKFSYDMITEHPNDAATPLAKNFIPAEIRRADTRCWR
jgi:hypothetical protein